MNSSPCAKLTTSMMPKIRVRPDATSARIMPVTMPLIVWMMIWSNGMADKKSMVSPRRSIQRAKSKPAWPAPVPALHVEQDDLGLEHHRARDRQHLLLAPRERAAGLVAALGQPREVAVDLVEQRVLARLRDALPVEPGAQVFEHGQEAEDAAVLGHVGD